MDRGKPMKNSVKTTTNVELLAYIQDSFLNPSAYMTNLRPVKEIDWQWDNGKTTTNVTYVDGEVSKRTNNDSPPTHACHDIAHFIAALNGNMEWDYLQPINHVAEYNAVAIEVIFSHACHQFFHKVEPNVEELMHIVFNHMQWFAEEYYLIHKDHPSKKSYKELMKDFLEVFDVDKAIKAFKIYYEVWSVEHTIGNPEFGLQVNMGSDLDFYDERVYDYLYKSKKFLQSLL